MQTELNREECFGDPEYFPSTPTAVEGDTQPFLQVSGPQKIGLDGSIIGHRKAEATVPTTALGRHKAALRGGHSLDKKSD